MKNRSIYAAVLVALALLVLIWAIFGRNSSEQDIVVALPTAAATDAAPSESEESAESVEISPRTVQAAISTLSRAASYSRSVTVSRYWSGGESATELSVWVDGNRTRIRIPSDTDARNILVDGEALYIWYDSVPDAMYSGTVTEENEADQYLSSLTYEDLLSLPVTDIFAARYEACEGENCIYVEYDSGALDYTNCVYISVATGLLMSAETYDANGLTYSMKSSAVELTTPDESMFALPSISTVG